MSAEASPRPWRVIYKPNGQLVLYTSIVKNADGRDVAFVCRSADAALIVDAVNERDRLRDLVRRLLMLRRGDIAVPLDMEKQIIADTRAAIGEEKE